MARFVGPCHSLCATRHSPLSMEGVPAVTEGAGLWGSALAQGVAHLPWLSPDAASLGALARPQVGDVWSEIRSDPGAVLLLVRGRSASEERPVATHSSLNDPALLE